MEEIHGKEHPAEDLEHAWWFLSGRVSAGGGGKVFRNKGWGLLPVRTEGHYLVGRGTKSQTETREVGT